MSGPPDHTPFNAEGQWLYSVFAPDDGALHPTSKTEPCPPLREAHFKPLYQNETTTTTTKNYFVRTKHDNSILVVLH